MTTDNAWPTCFRNMAVWDFEDTTIGLYLGVENWEIYYRKPGYFFQAAFGLPATESVEKARQLAEANVHNYNDLFT